VPTARCTRTIASPAGEVWELVADPHHLPRWWPRVVRVEGVERDAFTEVLASPRAGRLVRADFRVVAADERALRLVWVQQVDGTPFARLLAAAETELSLQVVGRATEVTIELRQALRGLLPRLGARRVRRAAQATLEEALDGLERVLG
jgi:uncharacterized protein YndB with AHSA1/START domain